MNLNQRIDELRSDGIPGYNAKINQVIRAVNWLMGVRVINGRNVRESDGGPVFDLSQANMTQPAGQAIDAIDPDGNKAGWTKVTGLDFDGSITGYTNSMYQLWMWTGQPPKNVLPIPWMVDPSNNESGWIVCADQTYWGTGQCPAGTTCSNFQAGHAIISYPNGQYHSPTIVTINPQAPPITPPTECSPTLYWYADSADMFSNGEWIPGNHVPGLVVSNGLTSNDPPTPFTWSLTITYDGTQIYFASGSATAVYGGGIIANMLEFDPAGWDYDPGALPGYAQGQKQWVYQFDGMPTSNPNPTIVQTFAYNIGGNALMSVVDPWKVVFMNGTTAGTKRKRRIRVPLIGRKR